MRGFQPLCALGLFAAGVGRNSVGAQTTSSVTCTTNPWSINREGQTPCQVGAALEGACFNNVWTIDPLPAGQKYSGPLLGQSNKCQCNSVAFSLIAACGACQGAGISTWPDWIVNCTPSDITIGAFPNTIPKGTNVPAWAYLDITTTGNVWDATAALAIANSNAPETTGGSPPGTPTASNASPAPSTFLPQSSIVPTSSGASSSSKAGPIAGGVVGGVVFLVALGVLAFFLYRRRHPHGSEEGPRYGGEKVDLVGASTPSPMYADGPQSPTLPMQQEPPRLYDPSDPSTFPTAPVTSSYTTGYGGSSDVVEGPPRYASPMTSGHYSPTPQHFSPPPGVGRGGYTGAPEV